MSGDHNTLGMNEQECHDFLMQLKQRKVLNSSDLAWRTVKYLQQKLVSTEWKTAGEALEIVKKNGKVLMSNLPSETTLGNLVRRVLKIIKEDYHSSDKEKTDDKDTQESLHKLLLADDIEEQYSTAKENLKDRINESFDELIREIFTSADNIAENAEKYLQPNEIIITSGRSRLVERFLKEAAKKIRFHVIVAECSPLYDGHDYAKSLADSKIETTVISDAAVFAMMSLCNKVIIGTKAVMADGGLKAMNGSHMLALAAKHYSVPMIVCAPMYKVSPEYLSSYDQDTFNTMSTPHPVLNYSEGPIIDQVSISSPLYDYVPPQLVTLYVTNIGGHTPPYIYRLLADLYHPDDYNLAEN